jgi:hypothetical protein
VLDSTVLNSEVENRFDDDSKDMDVCIDADDSDICVEEVNWASMLVDESIFP